ncbi:MAG: hypothetical protein M3O01_01075 [Pseudomonadota bacterium]|nr:hypothetical protein [Pseudomonadota bacterium]
MRMPNRFLPVFFVFAATMAAAADKPVDKPAEKASAPRTAAGFGGKASGPFLSKEELRKCLAREDALKARDAELLKEQAAIADRKTEIQRIGDDLKARVETIDRSNADAVAAYNEAVKSRDQQIDEYQARVDKFNSGIDQVKIDHDQFSQACSNRRYFEEDEAAIRKGK